MNAKSMDERVFSLILAWLLAGWFFVMSTLPQLNEAQRSWYEVAIATVIPILLSVGVCRQLELRVMSPHVRYRFCYFVLTAYFVTIGIYMWKGWLLEAYLLFLTTTVSATHRRFLHLAFGTQRTSRVRQHLVLLFFFAALWLAKWFSWTALLGYLAVVGVLYETLFAEDIRASEETGMLENRQ